jgi:hypothetical protein
LAECEVGCDAPRAFVAKRETTRRKAVSFKTFNSIPVSPRDFRFGETGFVALADS